MFLRQSSAVVYVLFYDDIELIIWIDGTYDDHYDSKVRYKTSDKNKHMPLIFSIPTFSFKISLRMFPPLPTHTDNPGPVF